MSETQTGTGYTHELLHFDTTERLVDEVVPWLREASARGETVALACEDEKNRALLEALGDQDRIVVLPRAEIYQKAVTAVAWYRDFMRRHLDAGGQGVRLIGEVKLPHRQSRLGRVATVRGAVQPRARTVPAVVGVRLRHPGAARPGAGDG